MTFANPLPWWAFALVVCAAALVSWHSYRRFSATSIRRHSLVALRFVTLLALVVVLMRPVARSSNVDAHDAIVPVLVDVSRSMGIEDADGQRRIDNARAFITRELSPALAGRFQTELLSFGESLSPVAVEALGAAARRSDLAGALAATRERYRGRPVAGIVLLSDGGDTGAVSAQSGAAEGAAPVYAFGVGSETLGDDREVLSVTAADGVLDDSRVDLAVSAISHGQSPDPIQLRLLENGRSIDVRSVRPPSGGGPVREVFHVSPPSGAASIYTVEIPGDTRDVVPENNSRSLLVQPPARQRRILLIEGAPGFEHSFLKRALALDRGIEFDSVVRKGVNEQGADTYYIQAARSRSGALAAGFPADLPSLFAYDAVVFGNVTASQLTSPQLEAAREFVSRRGGGLLVLGARSFLRGGLVGTAIEDVLPLSLDQRADTREPASLSRAANRVSLTESGLLHPVMQLAISGDQTRKRWDSLPALASAAPSGSARAGATVLATTSGAGGSERSLVAVQRYGEGRSMVFTGEASWRWRMMLPSGDRGYETFWRQAVRWLALDATDPVAVIPVAASAPGDVLALKVAVRDASFVAIPDAKVDLRIAGPDGRLQQLSAATDDAAQRGGGVFSASFTPSQPGVYKMTARARRGGTDAGSGSSSFLVGGADLEMTDPRLNLPVLNRLASASGGQLLTATQVPALLDALRLNAPVAALAVRRDLWHNGWSFAAIVSLLAAEWLLRRKWGLR
ncbi:MAG: glutamine amidotransferase [Vicinamibacterales bacterium]